MKNFKLNEKIQEALSSVLPLTAIVLLLSITIVPLSAGTMVLFLFGALLLIFGMGFFTLGVDMSMLPMGEGIGVEMSKAKKFYIPILLCFLLGFLITIAEPDLTVLAQQVPSIPDRTIILAVAVGVGVFLAVAACRILLQIPLAKLLVVVYTIIFALAFLTPDSFVAVSFDSGGVTTGPVTVPFIMAIGIGLATLRSDKHSLEDSFGLVALCSAGPIIAVMLLGIFYKPEDAAFTTTVIAQVETTSEAARMFAVALPHYFKEVGISIGPIVIAFFIFQLVKKRYNPHQMIRMTIGFFITYVGLALFLCGVNVGFMPVGQLIGSGIAGSQMSFLLIPIGMVIGYFIVAAEPAVHVLNKQVEEISNGSITQKMMGRSLSIGVCVSVGIAMLRILTGLHIMWFLIPGYAISLILTYFVPPIFTGIAFDSGGVASGPMTATFLLPMAMGACTAVNGNHMTDAFGCVAMVAMTPLITIQMLGFISVWKEKAKKRYIETQFNTLDDVIVFFDE